jgi:hypothetical protein
MFRSISQQAPYGLSADAVPDDDPVKYAWFLNESCLHKIAEKSSPGIRSK